LANINNPPPPPLRVRERRRCGKSAPLVENQIVMLANRFYACGLLSVDWFHAGGVVPSAHAGHYVLWFLYLPPLAIVIFSIGKSKLAEHRERRSRRHQPARGRDPLRNRQRQSSD
jgi:hypothetical protein